MTRRRFHAAPLAFSDNRRDVTLGADETRHLRDVLRIRVGNEVYVFDGEGREFQCEVAEINRSSAHLIVETEVEPARAESPLPLTLAVALLKGEKFDLVVQKAVELGVRSLVPVATSRADVKIKSEADADRKLARWQRIVLEATKQCGRARLMKIDAPIGLSNLINQSAENNGLRLMFAERSGESFKSILGDKSLPNEVVALVGPEGGFAEEEIAQAREAGWKIVTLGGRVMRAETAAIAIATLLQNRLGDLN